MPKLGATIKVDKIITITKLLSRLMFRSLIVMVRMGPAALATLLAPMENATYNDMIRIKSFRTGFSFCFFEIDSCSRDRQYRCLACGLGCPEEVCDQ